ncbi:hypothetical protein [Neisseria dumasiana]|uniref:Uncharacterized protein n=1 Tax=Neisseria dumasiana TaxID=1931275 RepID=A0ABX3WI45_9NEIS|nr:hypothetical protein [Neisseria dumasiana]OSI28328.1 hypothetical protein BV913_11765 [Neisseria dumasiana]UOO83864.1 hypothetical protein LVJ88_09200 [Neisseria dumasiana]
MKNKLHQYPTNYIFDSTLGRDEITPQWVAKLNQLTTYLDKYLNGIDKIHWDFYRYKDGCFSAVDMHGLNGETFSLTLTVGRENVWPSKLFEGLKKAEDADIQMLDTVDIHKLVTFILHQYELDTCISENNQLCFFRRTN